MRGRTRRTTGWGCLAPDGGLVAFTTWHAEPGGVFRDDDALDGVWRIRQPTGPHSWVNERALESGRVPVGGTGGR